MFAGVSERRLAGSLAFFGGGVFYIGESELLPRSRGEGHPILSGAATNLGFTLFYLVVQSP